MSQERHRCRYIYIGGKMISSFLNNDKFYEFISNMGNNLIPFSIAKYGENIYFLTPHFNFFKSERIDNNEILNTIKNDVNPFYYYLSNCGKDSFKKLPRYKIHSNYEYSSIYELMINHGTKNIKWL